MRSLLSISFQSGLMALLVGLHVPKAALAQQRTCDGLFRLAPRLLVAPASQSSSKSLVQNHEASRTVSQWIRDNQRFYWTEVREQYQALFEGLPAILNAETIVIGDLHSGNFGSVLVPKVGVRYSAFDIKDIGYGPAILDINRLIMNTIEIARRGKALSIEDERSIAKMIFAAYRSGLVKSEYELTDRFKEELPSEEKFLRKLRKKAGKKTEEDGTLRVDGETTYSLERAAQKFGVSEADLREQLLEVLRRHVGAGEIQDAITSVRDRGGSKDALRILVLFKLANGESILKELKELVPAALTEYRAQPPRAALEAEVSQFLDYDVAATFPLVGIAGREFVLRDKKLEPIIVPYKQEGPGDYVRLMELAVAHAQWTGTFHGRQLTAKAVKAKGDHVTANGDRHGMADGFVHSGNKISRELFAQTIAEVETELTDRLLAFNKRHVDHFRGRP